MPDELLWAPWRMEFIRQADDQDGCFLCNAAASDRDRELLVVAWGETCLCMLNRYPYNNGHLLIAPYRHEGTLDALTDAENLEIMTMARDATQALARAVSPHGYNIGANLGRVAGAGLADHFHMHVVPRWSGDVNFMTTVGSAKVIPQSLAELWSLLTEEWNHADA